jgi:hypothetical protein
MSSSLIRQDLVPMVSGYVLVMGACAIGLRLARRSARAEAAADAEATETAAVTDTNRPADQPNPAAVSTSVPMPGTAPARPAPGPKTGRARLRAVVRPEPGWRRLAVHSLATAVGGYLLLMVVIIGYYNLVAPVAGNFVESAFSGCAMLIGLTAPVWIALSWLTERKGWRL